MPAPKLWDDLLKMDPSLAQGPDITGAPEAPPAVIPQDDTTQRIAELHGLRNSDLGDTYDRMTSEAEGRKALSDKESKADKMQMWGGIIQAMAPALFGKELGGGIGAALGGVLSGKGSAMRSQSNREQSRVIGGEGISDAQAEALVRTYGISPQSAASVSRREWDDMLPLLKSTPYVYNQMRAQAQKPGMLGITESGKNERAAAENDTTIKAAEIRAAAKKGAGGGGGAPVDRASILANDQNVPYTLAKQALDELAAGTPLTTPSLENPARLIVNLRGKELAKAQVHAHTMSTDPMRGSPEVDRASILANDQNVPYALAKQALDEIASGTPLTTPALENPARLVINMSGKELAKAQVHAHTVSTDSTRGQYRAEAGATGKQLLPADRLALRTETDQLTKSVLSADEAFKNMGESAKKLMIGGSPAADAWSKATMSPEQQVNKSVIFGLMNAIRKDRSGLSVTKQEIAGIAAETGFPMGDNMSVESVLTSPEVLKAFLGRMVELVRAKRQSIAREYGADFWK